MRQNTLGPPQDLRQVSSALSAAPGCVRCQPRCSCPHPRVPSEPRRPLLRGPLLSPDHPVPCVSQCEPAAKAQQCREVTVLSGNKRGAANAATVPPTQTEQGELRIGCLPAVTLIGRTPRGPSTCPRQPCGHCGPTDLRVAAASPTLPKKKQLTAPGKRRRIEQNIVSRSTG